MFRDRAVSWEPVADAVHQVSGRSLVTASRGVDGAASGACPVFAGPSVLRQRWSAARISHRERYPHSRSTPRRRGDLEIPAERLGAGADVVEAVAVAAVIETAAVVNDLQDDPVL